MSLIEHAKREFLAVGYKPVEDLPKGDPDRWIQENVLELLDVMERQGHSGSSAKYLIHCFARLADYKPLAPLTGADDEWTEVAHNVFQNKRYSAIFKANGVAYDIDGYVFENDNTTFTSEMSWREITFPYEPPEKPQYIRLRSREVNPNTGKPEPGSGWWETEYPDYIVKEHGELMTKINKGETL